MRFVLRSAGAAIVGISLSACDAFASTSGCAGISVARSHPVPAVRVGPRQRTALVHLRGDLLEAVAVLRRVAIEMEGAIFVAAMFLF